MSKFRYNLLVKRMNKSSNIRDISAYIPTVSEKDIARGYIVRYFAQKSNDINSFIYEIDRGQYSSISTNPFYTITTLDWRIEGDPIEVKKSNSASIRLASQRIPKIGMYLPNLLQFHQK